MWHCSWNHINWIVKDLVHPKWVFIIHSIGDCPCSPFGNRNFGKNPPQIHGLIVDGRNPARKPVEVKVVYLIVWRVLAPSQVVGNGISTTIVIDIHRSFTSLRWPSFPHPSRAENDVLHFYISTHRLFNLTPPDVPALEIRLY